LEIGGAIHPQSSAFTATCDVAAIDISFAMSQLGKLYFTYVDADKRDRIAFISCDAHEPPFEEKTFDGIVMFAALHHFSDPKRLLVNLRRVLKPGGFIAVMCEPCVPTPGGVEYLRDLRKGINEQCWTVEEHGEIFLLSGLRLISGQIDDASLKVILS
jgi:ubiquinone/menaquinone biosynthesis C-methylase UbiE